MSAPVSSARGCDALLARALQDTWLHIGVRGRLLVRMARLEFGNFPYERYGYGKYIRSNEDRLVSGSAYFSTLDGRRHPSLACGGNESCLTSNVAVCGSRHVEFYCITFTHGKVMVDLLFLFVKFGQLTLVLHANTLHPDREIGGVPYGS